MARSGKAQKQLTSKIKGERLVKQVADGSELLKTLKNEEPQITENKKTKKLKSES
jgi:hypothetical protein